MLFSSQNVFLHSDYAMQQSLVIRPMTAADIETVVSLYCEVMDSTYVSFSELAEGKANAFFEISPRAGEIFRAQLVDFLSDPKHGFFAAFIGDEVVGFALASLRTAEAGHVECWLDDLGVRSSWRRRGIAKALVAEVFAWGAQERSEYFLLESGVLNESAHGLFRALGFRPLAFVFMREGRS